MRCPKCDSENSDTAKFCKKCGSPLKKTVSHESMINSMSNKSGSDNTTKYIIVALAIVVVVLAGAFVYLYGFNSNHTNDSQPQQRLKLKKLPAPRLLKLLRRHRLNRKPLQCRFWEEAFRPEGNWKTRHMLQYM